MIDEYIARMMDLKWWFHQVRSHCTRAMVAPLSIIVRAIGMDD
jgi:hypothetical protein